MNEDNLLKQYEFFLENLNDLLKKSPNKFVIIKNYQILKTCDSFDEARNYAEKNAKLNLGTFIIQKVTDKPQYLSRVVAS